MDKNITRKSLRIGAELESTANPNIGERYRVTTINKPNLWCDGAYIKYELENVVEGRRGFGGCTLNWLRTYFKLITEEDKSVTLNS